MSVSTSSSILACVTDFEAVMQRNISPMANDYVSGAAGDELTLAENRLAFDRIRLQPRVLVDVSRIDTGVTLFGDRLDFPILLAPTAYHKLIHPEGECETVRGADAAGATLVVSSLATTSIEDIRRASPSARLWFQLSRPDRPRLHPASIVVQRVEAAGCRALCLTVDTPVTRRPASRDALPVHPAERRRARELRRPAWNAGGTHRPAESEIYSGIVDPSMNWKDVEWLRSVAKIPILLKGVLAPDDAERAVGSGVDGIVVSNHGARNLDTVPATIEALPRIADRVGDQLTLLVDGGIRRGTDVLKALALGARAVMVGRPCLWGLGARGADGVTAVVRMLRTELEMAMALTGRPAIADIDRIGDLVGADQPIAVAADP